jgi:hypothetical protein
MGERITRAEIVGLTEQPWATNDDGYWCPSCGDLIARPETAEAGHLPDSCRQCGFPDPLEVAEYHLGPDDDFGEDEDDYFDCAMGPDGYCGKAGSEECDWECPYRGR